MDKELKAKWVAALRSGSYKQGHVWLRSSADTFCCLGVLCEMAGRTVASEKQCIEDYQWMRSLIGDERVAELWRRNDGTNQHHVHSFSEIAEYIEANL